MYRKTFHRLFILGFETVFGMVSKRWQSKKKMREAEGCAVQPTVRSGSCTPGRKASRTASPAKN
jgi:hypothetical protein